MLHNFCANDHTVKVDIFVWTDDDGVVMNPKVTTFGTKFKEWPYSSLSRWEIYMEQKELLANYDFIFSLDIDLYLVVPSCRDVFSERTGALVAWFEGAPRHTWPLERNVSSAAFVALNGDVKGYFTGAFIFASFNEFVTICQSCMEMHEKDRVKNIMPLWHDESYWNKYLSLNPPKKYCLVYTYTLNLRSTCG